MDSTSEVESISLWLQLLRRVGHAIEDGEP